MTLQYITLHYIALHSITMQNIIALHYIALLYSTSHCTILHDITLHGITSHCMTFRKLLFPISLQLKGTRLPQENWCCFRLTIIDHNCTVGVIYVYICIDCQSSILSHMVPEFINRFVATAKAASENPSIPYSTDSPFPRCWLSAT